MQLLKRSILLTTILYSGFTGFAQSQTSKNYAEQVNTTIGTKGKGHSVEEQYLEAGYTFPGATYPFGMVQFTSTFFDENKGFVINQLSGAGCHNMGNMPLLPMAGKLTKSPNDMMGYDPKININTAIAGYYKATLGDKASIELSVTPRTGIARIGFDKNEQYGTIIIGTGINSSVIKKAKAIIVGKNRLEGYADGGHFCGLGANYMLYFVAEFDQNASNVGTWLGNTINENTDTVSGANSGVYFTFQIKPGIPVHYKVGISYVSIENARENLKVENAAWNFDKIKNETQIAWNKYLGKIEVIGGSADRTIQFYTHLYHSFTHPSIFNDINGQYIGADNQIHKTESNYYTGFSNWDTYRTQIQLISLLAPDETANIITSLIEFAKQSGGGFPRWVMANYETGIMQGDPTSIVVSNAYAFGVKNFDLKLALSIMRSGAEVVGTKSQQEFTRPHLQQYNEKGYISESMGASMSLEYNSADFAIGQFALQAFNDKALYAQYLKSSQKWKNIYNPKTTWLQSRNANGSWKDQGEDWREASYQNYFWLVPHNLKGLIDTMGGNANAVKRLDDFFVKLNASYGQDWFAAGNEPDFQAPWIYNWTGEPYKTQNVVRRIIAEQYTNRNCGLPGNDDMGAMGAWYVWASIGLYPMIPGVGGFSINSPSFAQIKIHFKKGDVLINGGSESLPYINSLTINGVKYNKTWIGIDEFANSKNLQFELKSEPNKTWGLEANPPSFNN